MKKRKDVKGVIYLLHFSTAHYHAKHYLGWTQGNITDRLDSHMLGTGSKLMRAVTEEGISIVIAKLWAGTRNDERALKRQKHGPRLCPICRKEESNHGR